MTITQTHFSDALTHQAGHCAELGSPFMARLLHLLAARLEPGTALTDRLFGWPGDISGRGASLPLRLAGGLHAVALGAPDGPLAQAYPPHNVSDDDLWRAIEHSFETQANTLNTWLDQPPQTNEVRRSAALIATGLWLTDRFKLPLHLSELGASAGLNLNFDHFALMAGDARRGPDQAALTLRPDWTGPLPPDVRLRVRPDRRGVDLNPLVSDADIDRLRTYIWADQPDRMANLIAARSCGTPPVDWAMAQDWLPKRLATAPRGSVHLVYHTIAWQYFAPDEQAQCRAALEAQGAKATPDTPLAWLGVEADEIPNGAAITLRLWPGDTRFDLGRLDFHGRWIIWSPEQFKAVT